MSKYRISLDLEFEQPNTNRDAPDSLLSEPKIIQAGWVVIDLETGAIPQMRCYEVNIGVPLSSFIKNLTKITDSQISNGVTLNEIYSELKNTQLTFNAARVVLQWGHGDIEGLQKELEYPDDWPFGRSGQNVKHLYRTYAEANDLNVSGGLKKSMGRSGIQFQGKAHNAMIDAENTARMYYHLLKKMKA